MFKALHWLARVGVGFNPRFINYFRTHLARSSQGLGLNKIHNIELLLFFVLRCFSFEVLECLSFVLFCYYRSRFCLGFILDYKLKQIIRSISNTLKQKLQATVLFIYTGFLLDALTYVRTITT